VWDDRGREGRRRDATTFMYNKLLLPLTYAFDADLWGHSLVDFLDRLAEKRRASIGDK
jgi:hypothetical protein